MLEQHLINNSKQDVRIDYRIQTLDKKVFSSFLPLSLIIDTPVIQLKLLVLNRHKIKGANYKLYYFDPQLKTELLCLDDQQVPEHVQYIVLKQVHPSVYMDQSDHQPIPQVIKKDSYNHSNQTNSLAFEQASNLLEQQRDYMQEEPICPPHVFGQVKICRKLKCFYKEAYVEINPQISVINLYENKSKYPKRPYETIPLTSIKKIKTLNKAPCFSRKSYIMIVTRDLTLTVCFYDKEISVQWMNYIKQAIVFAQYLEARLSRCEDKQSFQIKDNIKKNDTKIQLIDSVQISNQIKSEVKHNNMSQYISTKKEIILLDYFQVERKIGSGSFGFIYLCKHKDSGVYYALKQLSKNALIQKRQLKYAITQLQILKMCDHPYIMKLSYAFQTRQNLYMALKYCQKGTLKQLIEDNGKLDLEDSILYLCELISAIQYLHSFDVIYRDLKPQNILLTQDFHIVLSDFGLAKTNVKDKADSFCGSPAYVSPELLIHSFTTKASDIYGIGLVFYQMVHGYQLYTAQDIVEVFQNIKDKEPQFDQSLPDNVKDFLRQTLEKDHKKRIKNLKKHPLLQNIDWKKIQKKKLHPNIKKHNSKSSLGWIQIDYKIDEDYNEMNYIQDRVEGWLYSINTKASN